MERGYNVGDRVVVKEVVGDDVDYAFGIVTHATRSRVSVQLYRATIKFVAIYATGGSSTVTLTCNFKEELTMTEKYRWLPSQSFMGRAGDEVWTEVKHFNEDEEYTSHTYY